MQPIQGIHHITAVAGDPQRNVDFYVQVLGQRFVKKTVNFDDPGTYNYICHEYCGYVEGSPIGHHTMYGQLIVEGADGAGATAAVVD